MSGCRPECVYNADCPSTLSCIKQHCRDPCIGTCGTNAHCTVVNHLPTCNCIGGFEGDPFSGCNRVPITSVTPISPCEPSPCGPNSICRNINGRPTCSCQTGFFGSPPSCRPECVVNSECNQQLSCINHRCQDPCVGICGINAVCKVFNHNPICSCMENYVGDPFEQCSPEREFLFHFFINIAKLCLSVYMFRRFFFEGFFEGVTLFSRVSKVSVFIVLVWQCEYCCETGNKFCCPLSVWFYY